MNLCLFYIGVKETAHPTPALPVFESCVNGTGSASDIPAVSISVNGHSFQLPEPTLAHLEL